MADSSACPDVTVGLRAFWHHGNSGVPKRMANLTMTNFKALGGWRTWWAILFVVLLVVVIRSCTKPSANEKAVSAVRGQISIVGAVFGSPPPLSVDTRWLPAAFSGGQVTLWNAPHLGVVWVDIETRRLVHDTDGAIQGKAIYEAVKQTFSQQLGPPTFVDEYTLNDPRKLYDCLDRSASTPASPAYPDCSWHSSWRDKRHTELSLRLSIDSGRRVTINQGVVAALGGKPGQQLVTFLIP